jgi:hypothetical protein
MNVVMVANFDLIEQEIAAEFPHAGVWYDYYRGGSELNVNEASSTITLSPGAFKLFTDVEVASTVVTSAERALENEIRIYPNPVEDRLVINWGHALIHEVSSYSSYGGRIPLKRSDDSAWDVSHLPPGLFIVQVKTNSGVYHMKLIKK